MPRLTVRVETPDGEVLTRQTEYICDWPDCPNVAEHVLGVVRELRSFAAVCTSHAQMLAARSKKH